MDDSSCPCTVSLLPVSTNRTPISPRKSILHDSGETKPALSLTFHNTHLPCSYDETTRVLDFYCQTSLSAALEKELVQEVKRNAEPKDMAGALEARIYPWTFHYLRLKLL